ncbi:MAG TPA: SDR family NAD(P)-dependent oxidoreductase [Ilumatobacteraceae bacterium]|jgi:NAD(P)-dependent dehydrogenase (short-subunit alcohol dehydrogenase family)|nr:SDR family NAD(P)-dependent oxidoreductase [Ilumatobacteraceae bacterium]
MEQFSGKVAAITGAGSGIGRGLALELAAEGCHLALSDVDDAGLAETVAMVARATGDRGSVRAGVRVSSNRVDVVDREAVDAWAVAIVDEFGQVNLIFNNAGVALSANVSAMTYESFRWLMDINFWGVVHGTLAFLPHLRASGDGHVVNVSSVFGLLGIPTQSAYNSAKFAVRGFTDALRTELDIEQCGVSATTIHPGGIRTNIARNARFEFAEHEEAVDAEQAAVDFERLARTTPEKAARLILGAVRKNKRRALIGPDAHLFDGAARISPRASQWALGKLVARSDTALA